MKKRMYNVLFPLGIIFVLFWGAAGQKSDEIYEAKALETETEIPKTETMKDMTEDLEQTEEGEPATETKEEESGEQEEPRDILYELNWGNIITPDMEEFDMSSEFVKISIPQFPSFTGYPLEINSVLIEDVRHHCRDVYDIGCSYELRGEVTYLDEQYISVLYQGTGYPYTAAWDFAWGTTIDIKTGEIVSIEDVAELPAVLEKLEQKEFEKVRGVDFDYYIELGGKEKNWKEEYENLSMGSYDENHCHDFYLKKGKIGVLLGIEQALGGYVIVELDR